MEGSAAGGGTARDRFDDFMNKSAAAKGVQSDADREALFKQFQAWEAEKNGNGRPRQR